MKEELRDIGLTDGEIAVYLALLRFGPSTNSPLARHTGLQSSTIYYCLNSLIEKGFVSYTLRGNRKHFMPADPQTLLVLLDSRAKELLGQRQRVEKILPALQAERERWQERTAAEVYEGMNGLQMIFNNILATAQSGEVYEAFAIEQQLDEPEEIRLLLSRINREVRSKGVRLRLLAHTRMRPVFEKMYGKRYLASYPEVRYIDELTPVGITLYRNNVITHITENDRPVSFLVRNKKLADTYREYFYAVWARAKA